MLVNSRAERSVDKTNFVFHRWRVGGGVVQRWRCGEVSVSISYLGCIRRVTRLSLVLDYFQHLADSFLEAELLGDILWYRN